MPSSINLNVTTSEFSSETIRTVAPNGVLSRVIKSPFPCENGFQYQLNPRGGQIVGRVFDAIVRADFHSLWAGGEKFEADLRNSALGLGDISQIAPELSKLTVTLSFTCIYV